MWRRSLALAVTALLLAACDPDAPEPTGLPGNTPAASPTSSDTLVISLIASATGETGSEWADAAFRGADLAVHELNRTRDEDEPVIELVTLDDGGDPDTATELVREQASSERTIGVVYAGPPQGLPPAEKALAQAGIPALLCYGDLYGARLLSPHVFQVSPPHLWQGRVIARYLLRDRRYRRIGFLSVGSWSERVALSGLREAFAERGAKLAATESVGRAASEMFRAFRSLRRAKVEAIVLDAPPPLGLRIPAVLEHDGHGYRTTARARIASAPSPKKARRHARAWRPQLIGFDSVFGRVAGPPRRGTVVAETYAAGAHYLPIPSFEEFRKAYSGWWESPPLDSERRAYEAVQMIGWATRRTPDGRDSAATLERLRSERFGGLDVTFGPDDHTSVDPTTIGLWVIPRRGAAPETQRLPRGLPWVPLGRGFSIDGERTDIQARDWKFLFVGSPPMNRPSPKIERSRFGVTSPRSDPVH